MLDYIVGFAVSVLSGIGIGGGGLLVIWLVLYHGMDQIQAQSINLVYFLFSSSAAMLVHLTKRKLNFQLIFFLSVIGMLGAFLGSFIANSAEPDTVRTLFGYLLLVSGIISLVK